MPPSPSTTPVSDQYSDPPRFEDGPDDVFALVAGLYAAIVLVPLALVAVWGVLSSVGTRYVVFLAGVVFVVTTVALSIRRVTGLDRRLGTTRLRWTLLVVPPALAAVGAVVSDSPVALVFGFVAALGGLALGAVLAMMATTRYAKAMEQRAEQLAEWRASWSEGRRTTTKALGALAVIAGIGAFAVQLVGDFAAVRPFGNILISLGVVVFVFGQQSRTFRASMAGLTRQMPANRALYGWDRFEGYVVAEDAVVVHFRAPWRLPLIFDRTELDDEAAVLDALDDHLPRLPAP